MRAPVTAIDTRFSDPDSSGTTWEVTRRVLESAEMFWVTTVRKDGRPHVTPLVAVWLDGAIYFCTGGGEQKAVNLGGNAHVVLTTGCNDWAQGVDVTVEGRATRVTDAPLLERLAERWAMKWDGRWNFVTGDGCFHHGGESNGPREQILVFSVTPNKVLAFSKGEFSQTSYRAPVVDPHRNH
jgi:general stress protein 26